MTTTKPKMKGIFKGFKYISQIFDEDKDDEIQIGFPTDVKHVAHIGWDGPTIDSPSWMKEFSASTGFQSAPLAPSTGGDSPIGEPEIKWVSEDSNTRRSSKPPLDSPGRDLPDVPRSSRRHHSSSSSSAAAAAANESSPRKKDPSTRPRRRTHSKDSSEGGSVRSNRETCDSPSRGIPADPARKSRRKKSRELGGDGSTRSRHKPPSTADALPSSSDNINDNNNKEESIDKNSPPADPVPST